MEVCHVGGYLLEGSRPRGLDGNWQGWGREKERNPLFFVLCSDCQGWPLGVSQLRRRSLYHIKGASKEPLQQHFGPAWRNRACFDWSATFNCHHCGPTACSCLSYTATVALWETLAQHMCTHTCTASRNANVGIRVCTWAYAGLRHVCAQTHIRKLQGILKRLETFQSVLLIALVK